MKHVKDLSEKEVVALRKEVVLGSLFYEDYENSFGIDEHEVCDFFDGFLEMMSSEAYEGGIVDDGWADYLREHDNADELRNYFFDYVCC